jgi:hypothetical protein
MLKRMQKAAGVVEKHVGREAPDLQLAHDTKWLETKRVGQRTVEYLCEENDNIRDDERLYRGRDRPWSKRERRAW